MFWRCGMNDNNKLTVDQNFLNVIKENLKDGEELELRRIYKLFPEVSRATVSWRLHKLVEQGKLYRTGHGYYSLKNRSEHSAAGYDYLQKKSKKVYDAVTEYGYEFYISGLDSLVGEILHIPEQHPVILVVEEIGFDEIKEALNNNEFFAVTEKDKNLLDNGTIKNKVDVIMLKGKDFSLATDYIADKEKGFVDLYYAITRLEYSFSIPELSRIYESMGRNNSIASIKMKKAAKDRGISIEINWLLELKKVSKKTAEFMAYQIKEAQ